MYRILLLSLNLVCYLSAVGQEFAKITSKETVYQILDEKSALINDHYTITINSEKGKPFAVYRNYSDQFRKITQVNITIFDSNGNKVKKLNQSNGHEFGFSPSNEIDDGKVLVIDPEYQNYPFTMKVESKIKLNGFLSLPTWLPQYYFHLTVNHASLKVIAPENIKLNILSNHIEESSVVENGRVIRTYEVLNLPSQDEKVRYQDFYDECAKVMIAPSQFQMDGTKGGNDSWTQFGDWFLSLNNKPYKLQESTKQYIHKIESKEKKEIIKHLYAHMQDKTRYVSIQLGIGGFKSMSAWEVEKLGYGDCKALTTYMKSLLDYAGISSNYVLVRAGRDVPDVIKNFPSSQFNHVYLGVPLEGDTIFLECTNQNLPAGHTGSFTDDRNVLWVAEGNSQIIRSRIYTKEENIKKSVAEMKLSSNGDAVVDMKIKSGGVFFDELLRYKISKEDQIELYNQSLFDYDDFTITDFNYLHKYRDQPVFEKSYSLKINGFGKKVGDRIILPAIPLKSIDNYIDFDELKRYASVKRGFTILDQVTLKMDDNFWVEKAMDTVIESPIGKIEVLVEFDGKNLVMKRKLSIEKGQYVDDKYSLFQEFRDKVKKLERNKIVLNVKT